MRTINIVLAVIGVASAGIAAAYVIFSDGGGVSAPGDATPPSTTTEAAPTATAATGT